MWTEITRPKYDRGGLRYASDLTDAEWELVEPYLPPAADDGSARGGERNPVPAQERLSVASAAEGVSATLDRTAVFLCLAGRRHMAADQSPSADGGAPGRGARGQSLGRGDRQPVGEDHRKRRPARVRRGQEDQGPQAPHPHRHRRLAGRRRGSCRLNPGPRWRTRRVGRDPRRLPVAAPCLRRRRLCRLQAPRRPGALARIGAWTFEIVKRSHAATGFTVLPRRWVVERTFAWLNRNRRLAKDFEASIASAEAWLYIASVQLITRRLARA